jgi:glyceraldehyde-3-phosphate dehydrogenase (NADP+)
MVLTRLNAAAAKAYNSGRGEWPRLRPMERIAAVEKFLQGLRQKRDEIVNLLMWEICKNSADAAKEVDRTIKYVEDTIKSLKVRSTSRVCDFCCF